jgi:hypothetical protein
MTSDVELDRILGTWLAQGGDRAPAVDVDQALATVAATPQSRRRRRHGIGRLGLLAAGLALLSLLGLALGIGSGLIRLALPDPTDTSVDPSTVPSPATGVTDLLPVAIDDWSVRLGIPTRWAVVDEPEQGFDFRHFSGGQPEGHLSVSHESPYEVTVCLPRCDRIDLPAMIPYSAEIQLAALKAGVASITGTSAWTALDDPLLPEVTGAARQDATSVDGDGRVWRHVVIVGLRDRNAVSIAWSQPEAGFDDVLLDRVLAGIELPSGPVYSDGDLIEATALDGSFRLPMPGHWITPDQPRLDGVAMTGLHRFGDGPVLISIGDESGTLGWCDPDCRIAADQTSLDALEATIREGGVTGPAMPTTLDGEPGRLIAAEAPTDRRHVVAMHDGRPVAIRIDVGDWEVAPGVVDRMLAGFHFTDPPEAGSTDPAVTTSDGSVSLGLPAGWRETRRTDQVLVLERGPRQVMVSVGQADGSVLPCLKRAGPWERCRPIRAKELEALAAAVEPLPEGEPGIALPIVRRDDGVLGGEPAVILRIDAYEHPGRGGQEVVYVVAMHDDRPFVVRLWTSANDFGDLGPILAGFRFVD